MLGIHLTILPGKLRELAELRRHGESASPEGARVLAEYVWDLRFLVILVDTDDVNSAKAFAQQFSEYAADCEIASVAMLEEFASSTRAQRAKSC